MRVTTSLIVLGLTASLSCAQDGSSSAQSSATSSASTNVMAAQLQLELNSLNSITDALGPMVGDAEKRLKLMKGYVTKLQLNDEAKAFVSKENPTPFTGITFNQALQTATKNQQARGTATPTTNDTGTLENEVNATQTLVQSQWSNLNKLHTQVDGYSDFLKSKQKFDDYLAWAQTDEARNMLQAKPAPPPSDKNAGLTPEQIEAKNKRHQQYQARLKEEWDLAEATDSQPDVVATSPLSDHINNNTAYDNRPYGGDYGGGYYAGSYWNGYADPYYDVGGYPAGCAAARAAWNRGGDGRGVGGGAAVGGHGGRR